MTETLRYRQVADAIRRRIGAGEYPSGALETEAELCRAYEVSRITVRKALELLRDEGIVTSRKGSGWRVAVDPLRDVTMPSSRSSSSALRTVMRLTPKSAPSWASVSRAPLG